MSAHPNPLIILHGWSDHSQAFEPLARELARRGRSVLPLWLGDYVSMEDAVTVDDVAQALEAALQTLILARSLQAPLDMIVHSTGGLVARAWLSRFDRHRTEPWLARLVMLAPANHGARLASTGKSLVVRLSMGLPHGFQTGAQMLNALELGSPWQWSQSLSDVLHDASLGEAGPAVYGSQACMPFVLAGTRGYQSLLRQAFNEPGADGVVRAAAANLNCRGATLDFSVDPSEPVFTPWAPRDDLAPYALGLMPDEDHTSITEAQGALTLSCILQALDCPREDAAYRQVVQEWEDRNAQVCDGRTDADSTSAQHHYLQLNTFVVDDRGSPVEDHFIEFSAPDPQRDERAMSYFHAQVLEHCHKNQVNSACRCFYIDRSDLMNGFYPQVAAGAAAELRLSISAAAPSTRVSYLGRGSGAWRIHLQDESLAHERWLRRHTTHYLKIIIPRTADDSVLKLRAFGL